MAEASNGGTVLVFGNQRVASAISKEPGVTFLDDIDRLLTELANGVSVLGFVIWAEAVPGPDTGRLIDAIKASEHRCVEVRAERWDGRTPSPLSAACGGVISGFGVGGLLAAVRLVRQ